MTEQHTEQASARIERAGEPALGCGALAELEPADPRVGAFLDLDHTVLHGSSGMLFLRYMWNRRLISSRQVLGIVREGLLYKLGRGDFTASSRRMIRLIAGTPEEEMWTRSRAWFEAMVAAHVTVAARQCVGQHRGRRHQVALLSASTPFATVLVAETLGLRPKDALSTQLEVIEGVLTGEVVEPICYGEGKVHWAETYAAEHDVDLRRSFFYTDSYSDLPMIRAVGHPVIVNPDRRLRALALREGWPIVRFY